MQLLRDLVDELLHAKVKAQLFGGDHAPKLGRLVIRERIGAGAMGTVFEAFDPRLERKVAVKVLRADVDAKRVLAEARALAKLQHPNVVAVHDADELDGLVYIVMEHVTGPSLRTWIGGAPHPWPDVVRVMREAAAGIAAAHAAGLVHRDIKPDNILIGEDRARVVDFGLAHVQLADDGTSAGTPFYMAPEVLAGGAATAASDQFSLGVTLYEALYGKRPHGPLPTAEAATEPATTKSETESGLAKSAIGGSAMLHRIGNANPASRDQLLLELRDAAKVAAAAPRPPGSDVPAWLDAIVSRTLAADPTARFASMSALGDALATGLARPRRRSRAVIFASVGLALGVVAGVVAYRQHAADGDSCTGGPSRIARAWSPDTRAQIEKAFAGTPWASQTLAALDGKAIDWQSTYRQVCLATKRGEQSSALLDLRMRCLERQLDRFAALTTELVANPRGSTHDASSSADGAIGSSTSSSHVARGALDIAARVAAPSAVAEIDVVACERLTDAAELAIPRDPAERDRVRQQQRAIDRARTLFSLGRYTHASEALPPQDAVTLPRLRAERLSLAAAIEARVGNADTARGLLDQALVAAAEANAPRIELDVWSRRLRNELFGGSPAKVLEHESFARAAATRANLDGAELDGIVGEALRNAGQLVRAKQLLERAAASSDPLRPEQRALIEMNLGSVELATGHSTKALQTFTEARDTILSAFGDEHPDLALYDDKLAAAYRAQGKLRKALDLHAQSLALRIAAFGESDRAVATSLLYRAQTHLEAGDVLAADADATRAKAIREKTYGAKSPRLGEVFATLADIAFERGVPELAAQQYAMAASLDPRITPTEDALLSIDRAVALRNQIRELVAQDKNEEAAGLAKQLRLHVADNIADDLDLALVTPIAEALLATGDRSAALEILEPATKRLSNEPTRTSLHFMIAYAKATQNPQAARTTVSLYQALPKLQRSDYDEIWELSTRPGK